MLRGDERDFTLRRQDIPLSPTLRRKKEEKKNPADRGLLQEGFK